MFIIFITLQSETEDKSLQLKLFNRAQYVCYILSIKICKWYYILLKRRPVETQTLE